MTDCPRTLSCTNNIEDNIVLDYKILMDTQQPKGEECK
jgi:hypothetical protein